MLFVVTYFLDLLKSSFCTLTKYILPRKAYDDGNGLMAISGQRSFIYYAHALIKQHFPLGGKGNRHRHPWKWCCGSAETSTTTTASTSTAATVVHRSSMKFIRYVLIGSTKDFNNFLRHATILLSHKEADCVALLAGATCTADSVDVCAIETQVARTIGWLRK